MAFSGGSAAAAAADEQNLIDPAFVSIYREKLQSVRQEVGFELQILKLHELMATAVEDDGGSDGGAGCVVGGPSRLVTFFHVLLGNTGTSQMNHLYIMNISY